MSITVFKNAAIYTPYEVIPKGTLMIKGERIEFVGSANDLLIPPGAEIVDAGGKNLCPGFIDIHTHGAMGVDFMDADKIEKVLSHHAFHGTTSLLATTMSASHEKLLSICEKLSQFADSSEHGPEILGIHLEGPYINPEKRGIHDPKTIRTPSVEELKAYQERSGKLIKLLTLAPEQPGAEDLIAECLRIQVVPAVAHSKAEYEVILKAKSIGLKHASHFFNTLAPFHHRQLGTIGAVLDDPDFTVELIADGIHLHPATVRLAYRLKGADKIILATDASPFSGLKPGIFQDSDGMSITVSDQGVFRDNTLAGSNLTMIKAVENMTVFTGCSLSQAIRMATVNPAGLLGIDSRKGSLETGKDADLLLFDKSLKINRVYCRGKVCE